MIKNGAEDLNEQIKNLSEQIDKQKRTDKATEKIFERPEELPVLMPVRPQSMTVNAVIESILAKGPLPESSFRQVVLLLAGANKAADLEISMAVMDRIERTLPAFAMLMQKRLSPEEAEIHELELRLRKAQLQVQLDDLEIVKHAKIKA